MRNKLIVLLVIIFSIMISRIQKNIFAQEDSSASADQIQENIKERIQKTVQENTARIKGLTTNSNRKAVWGKIKRISDGSINLETLHGTQIISISEDVQLLQNEKPIAIKDMEIENEAVVYGTVDGEDFTPDKIEISKESLQPTEKLLSIGNIESITKTSITITTRDKNESEIYEFQKNSLYQQLDGEEITLADLEEGLDVLIISQTNTSTKAVKDSKGVIVVLHALMNIEK